MVRQAPPLPDNIADWVVILAPYLNIFAILMMVSRIIPSFALVGLVSFFIPTAGLAFPFLMLIYLITVINLVLMLLASRGLFRKYQGAWRLIFYLILLNIIVGLLSFSIFGIFRTIILGLISLYIWFQVEDKYTK
ncbi:hypothetical protein HC766_03975 [Candidatus Gracilibacteria bacterium]|nr:hypothetical protein [Candidatus Gracilibacteria bacterium]NJS41489.1 hypothetical protein [Candidatus Gracilibacteria bacterium]